jgi:hypothetical protein
VPTATCFGTKVPSSGSFTATEVHRSNRYFRLCSQWPYRCVVLLLQKCGCTIWCCNIYRLLAFMLKYGWIVPAVYNRAHDLICLVSTTLIVTTQSVFLINLDLVFALTLTGPTFSYTRQCCALHEAQIRYQIDTLGCSVLCNLPSDHAVSLLFFGN